MVLKSSKLKNKNVKPQNWQKQINDLREFYEKIINKLNKKKFHHRWDRFIWIYFCKVFIKKSSCKIIIFSRDEKNNSI